MVPTKMAQGSDDLRSEPRVQCKHNSVWGLDMGLDTNAQTMCECTLNVISMG